MNLVDIRAMQIQLAQVSSYFLGKFLYRANAFPMLAGAAFPDGKRRSPVTLATQCPIDVIGKPVAKATLPHMLGYPVDGIIQIHQLIAERARTDVPGLTRVIQQRRMAPPAEGIRVCVRFRSEQQATGLQVLNNERISILDKNPAPRLNFRDKGPIR